MTSSSRQIVKEVNNTHLEEALALVVKRSRSSMGADECSVQLGGALFHLLAKWDFSRRMNEPSLGKMLVRGIPCAPGLATGSIVLSEPAGLQSIPDRNAQDIASARTT